MSRALLLMLLVATGAADAATAPCTADAGKVSAATRSFYARQSQQPLPLTVEDGLCFRKAFVRELSRKEGAVVGYKVGLYTQASQKTFGANGPAIGVLLRGMVLENVEEVPATLGFAPVAEADFVLVVGDDAINEAKSRDEFYQGLRGYRPFIELPDNNYPAGTPVSAGQLIALNVNARSAIAGKENPLEATPAGMARLVNFSVVMSVDGLGGNKRVAGKAVDTLGDPIAIAMFARDALLREGGRLRPGDLISLGAVVAPHPPRPGDRFHVRYQLGDEVSEISVRFGP
jgi:2-oxo-hept-3-ene-1,7-dioate hydratase